MDMETTHNKMYTQVVDGVHRNQERESIATTTGH